MSGIGLGKKALQAAHNTTAKGVRAAQELGGIPSPSHAVIPEGQPFSSFGDITLVAGKDMVDPASGHPLFGADVYSRRQPKPLYRASKKIVSPEANAVKDAMEELKDSHRWEFYDGLKSGDPRDLRSISSSDGAMLAYARANGVDIDVPQNTLSTNEIYNLGADRRAIEKKMGDWLDDGGDINDPEFLELNSQAKAIREKIDANKPPSAYEIREKLKEAGVDPYGIEDWISQSLIDNGDWSQPYFLRGKKKVDYTAENLSDYMNARTRGQEQTMAEGLGKQRSLSAKKFSSIEQARKHYEKLVPSDEMSAFAEKSNEILFSIADKVDSEYSSQFQKLDDLSSAVGDVMKGASPQTALRRNGLSGDVDDELIALADRVQNGPTEYFESKFRGIANLGDYAGAVVPENTPTDVIDTLKSQGLQVETYTDEASRTAARSKIPGSSFVVPLAGIGALASQESEAAAGSARRLIRYPAAVPPQYADTDYLARGGQLIEMSPDEFLSRGSTLDIDDVSRDNINDLKEMMLSGREIDPPALYGGTGVRATDGRHRAIAAKELGLDSIPVIDLSNEKGFADPKLLAAISAGGAVGAFAKKRAAKQEYWDEVMGVLDVGADFLSGLGGPILASLGTISEAQRGGLSGLSDFKETALEQTNYTLRTKRGEELSEAGQQAIGGALAAPLAAGSKLIEPVQPLIDPLADLYKRIPKDVQALLESYADLF